MSKELPYFKFFSDQWLGKKITLEAFDVQGVFINVCAIYWANDCDIKIATLQKRYGEVINHLIEEDFIKDKNGIAKISFLDSQWQERYKNHKENSKNGKAGAEKRWANHRGANSEANGEAIKNGMPIREDKKRKYKIIKDNIDTRKQKFKESLEPFLQTYGKDLLNNFYKYWTEPNKSNTKFRMELEKTWSLERRLETWANNDKGFNKQTATIPTRRALT